MLLAEALQIAVRLFETAQANGDQLAELQQAKHLICVQIKAEMERRESVRPPKHHMCSYNLPMGQSGQRRTFMRDGDSREVHPPGSRGWYETWEACLAAMWDDHDEMTLSPGTTHILVIWNTNEAGLEAFQFQYHSSAAALLAATEANTKTTPLTLPDALWMRAVEVFGAPPKAILWLLRENRGLGRRPIELVREDRAHEVNDVLERIEHGIHG